MALPSADSFSNSKFRTFNSRKSTWHNMREYWCISNGLPWYSFQMMPSSAARSPSSNQTVRPFTRQPARTSSAEGGGGDEGGERSLIGFSESSLEQLKGFCRFSSTCRTVSHRGSGVREKRRDPMTWMQKCIRRTGQYLRESPSWDEASLNRRWIFSPKSRWSLLSTHSPGDLSVSPVLESASFSRRKP